MNRDRRPTSGLVQYAQASKAKNADSRKSFVILRQAVTLELHAARPFQNPSKTASADFKADKPFVWRCGRLSPGAAQFRGEGRF